MKKLHIFSGYFLLLLSLSSQAKTDLKNNREVYSLWEQYYQIEKISSDKAANFLEQLSQKTPQDPKVWKTWAYLEMRKNNNDQALKYIERTLELDPSDEQLWIQKGYLLNRAHQDAEALEVFRRLESSSDPEIAAKSKQAVQNLTGSSKNITKNTFGDIYFSPSYEGRYDTAILPLKLRYGHYWGKEKLGQIYGFTNINRDTRSTGGARPEIIDQNAIILGIGANYRPWEWPIYMYFEVGGSYDLIDLNRKKFRENINLGITGYQEWYWLKNQFTHSPTKQETQYFSEIYTNLAVYSRESYNLIGDFRLRTGWNFNRENLGNMQAYLKLHTINDSNNEYYNNLAEIGSGLAWQPIDFPIKLRIEKMFGTYINGTPNSVKKNFDNTRFELTYYWSF